MRGQIFEDLAAVNVRQHHVVQHGPPHASWRSSRRAVAQSAASQTLALALGDAVAALGAARWRAGLSRRRRRR